MDAAKKSLLDRRFALLFETAKRSLLITDMLLRQIAQDLSSFENDLDMDVDIGERAIPPLTAAIALVDFAFRFQGVIENLPYIRKDATEMKRLQAALKPIEESRHYLQHMRGDLSKNEEIDYPLLGALSWTHNMTAYSVSLSQPGQTSVSSSVFDTQEMKWVSKHNFIVKHTYIDLDLTLAEMHTVFDWICTLIRSSEPDGMKLMWGKTKGFSARMSIKVNEDSL